MIFEEVAKAIGVKTYPEKMEEFYRAEEQSIACDVSLIDDLQQEFRLFGDYYELVKEYAVRCNESAAHSAWIRTAVAFAKAGDFTQACSVPVPAADGTVLTSMLPFYIVLAQIPDALAEYRKRGFSEDEIRSLFCVFRASLSAVENRTGTPGINTSFYTWDTVFTKVQIFNVGGLQFQLKTLPNRAVYLREKATGRVVPLMCNGTYHPSGAQMIGSAGYEDDTDAFTCHFSEDDAYYYGYAVTDGVVEPTERSFAKTEWECVLRPGDECLSMHIPSRSDISTEATDKAIAAARRLVKERFPEFSGNRVYCSSWLLDPKLGKLLGDQAKITQFQKRYVRIPEWSDGMHVFGNVFFGRFDSYEDLPEETRLQRALKDLYLKGGYIYCYSGIIVS